MDKELKNLTKNKLIPLYFSNKDEYNKQKLQYSLFLNILETFFNIKVFNIKTIQKIIQDKKLITTIFRKKQEQLMKIHDKLKVKDFSVAKVQETLNRFLEMNPPLIQPILLTTLNTTSFAKYNIFCLLEDKSNIEKKINKIKTLFPRCIIGKGTELLRNEKILYLDIFLPNLSTKEKKILISNFRNSFYDNLIYLSRFNFHGIMNVFSLKEFYHNENGKYFYTEDLFSQFNLYVRGVFFFFLKPQISKKRKVSNFFKDQHNTNIN